MKEISITEIGPVRIGQTENRDAATGCTVFICEQGMRAGLDVRGGGPASRESQLLNPLMAAQFIHAILLSGGSAYGLGAIADKSGWNGVFLLLLALSALATVLSFAVPALEKLGKKKGDNEAKK